MARNFRNLVDQGPLLINRCSRSIPQSSHGIFWEHFDVADVAVFAFIALPLFVPDVVSACTKAIGVTFCSHTIPAWRLPFLWATSHRVSAFRPVAEHLSHSIISIVATEWSTPSVAFLITPLIDAKVLWMAESFIGVPVNVFTVGLLSSSVSLYWAD